MSSFLPTGYTAPKTTGNYYKFEEGENRFRVMSSAIIGWMYWNLDNKPVRSKMPFKSIPVGARLEDGQFKPKHFWAFVVWSEKDNRLQILEVTQMTIMTAIEALVTNPKWGLPQSYDIVVKATGDGLKREYSVVPEPHTPAPDKDVSGIKLEALYRGEDPFNPAASDVEPEVDATPANAEPAEVPVID